MFWQTVLANMLGATAATLLGSMLSNGGTRGVARLKRLATPKYIALFVLVFVALFATDFTPIQFGQTMRVALFGPPSLNERWTRDAWRAFNRDNFVMAVSNAQKVIDEYSFIASRQQADIVRRRTPEPSDGKTGPFDTMRIFRSGLVNDVGTCYWIQGRSFEAMGRPAEAAAAYKQAMAFPYARTYDPQGWPIRGWSPVGWFWSPAVSAEGRIGMLNSRR